MDVNQIKLEAGLPSEVTVTMSMAEVVAIAVVFGCMNGYAHRRLGLTGETPYGTLVDEVINRYWDDGVAEFRLDHITLPTLNDKPT